MVHVQEILDGIHPMRTCVLIPAYNESHHIVRLINEIKKTGLPMFVIDDGSQDDTARLAEEAGVPVIRNERNLGKGQSLIRGFHAMLEKNFDSVITIDADGQHDPAEIIRFVETATTSPNSIFVGNRLMQPVGMPWSRLLTNKIMSWAISLIAKQKIPDTQCGFRLIKNGLLRNLKLKTANYEIESEVLLRAARLGYTIESIPISSIYRNEKSQINPCIDTIRFLRFIMREIFIP